MTYNRHEFIDGETILNAQIMNEIEDGIVNNNEAIEINPNLNMIVFGDSLFGKEANYAQLFFKNDLGCNLRNYAVSGATITRTNKTTSNSLLNQWDLFLADFKKLKANPKETELNISTHEWYSNQLNRVNGESNFIEPDVFIIDGGGNDLNNNVPLYGGKYSEVHTGNFLATAPTIDLIDQQCFCGGLEALLWSISENFPKAKKFFVKMHRTLHTVCDKESKDIFITKYWPTDKATRGYNMDDLYDIVDYYCKLYGFEIIDIYNNSCLNTQGEKTVIMEETNSNNSKLEYWVLRHDLSITENTEGYFYIIGGDSQYFGFKKDDNNNGGVTSLDKRPTKWSDQFSATIYNSAGEKIGETTLWKRLASIEFFDYKGLHPTELGYKIGYLPHFKKALQNCPKISNK